MVFLPEWMDRYLRTVLVIVSAVHHIEVGSSSLSPLAHGKSLFQKGLALKARGDFASASMAFWHSIISDFKPLESAVAHFHNCYAQRGMPEEGMLFVAKCT